LLILIIQKADHGWSNRMNDSNGNEIKTDVDLLKHQIGAIADESNLPKRYSVKPNKIGNGRIITDTNTDISIEVGLFAYQDVCEVLTAFNF
jgi:hypothetical protein